MSEAMTIGRFAAASGVGIETVRFYQRRKLLPVPGRGKGAYREYDDALVRQVRFIRRAQLAGFTLNEISELLALDRSRERDRVRDMTRQKLAELDARLRQMRSVRRGLKALLDHCEHAPSNSPCPIIESFDATDHH